MESNNPFKHAEDEYFILRGKLETGRLTREQFESALHDLMIEDTLGRSWVLGVDSGKWFVHDGQAWLEENPYSAGVVGKTVTVPRPAAPPRPVERPAPVAAAKPKRGIGCFQTGCLIVLGIVVLFSAWIAAMYFRIPQQLGLVPSAQRVFADTPDREAASALKDELTKAGIDTKGMSIYVLPYRAKPGSVTYVTLDSAQGFKFKSDSKDPVIDYFKQMTQSQSAKEYGIQRIAIEYKGATGTPLLSLTAPTDMITAFANGAISRSEFLGKVDGQANWVGFYQEVMK